MHIRNIVIVLLLITSVFVRAGEEETRSGFEFLRTDIGARPASMGGAFVAVVGDLHGLKYNPASLASTRDLESTFTFLDHLLDIKSGFIGFSKSIKSTGRLGIGISYNHYGELKRTDILGDDLGTFSPYDAVFSVTYANSLIEGMSAGISLKYIYSKIDQYTAGALAADVGFIYCISRQDLNVGFSALNLGRSVQAFIEEHEKLPTSYRLGVSKKLAHLPLILNFDVIKYQYDKSSLFWGLYWALGGEFTVSDNLHLRWGYNSRGAEEKVSSDTGRFAGVSLGLGIQWERYRLDYGYSSYGALGAMNNFTITIFM